MALKTSLSPGNYLMLTGKTTYGKRIIANLGEFWQIDEVTVLEEIPSLMLHRCLIEEKIRGVSESLVIDKDTKLIVSVNDDTNFIYEQVVYEEDNGPQG